MPVSSGNILTLVVGAPQKSLKNKFKINDKEFFLALGWLAREEKQVLPTVLAGISIRNSQVNFHLIIICLIPFI